MGETLLQSTFRFIQGVSSFMSDSVSLANPFHISHTDASLPHSGAGGVVGANPLAEIASIGMKALKLQKLRVRHFVNRTLGTNSTTS